MISVKSDIERLEEIYNFRDKPEVIAYLANHPEIMPVLLQAPEQIEKYFPEAPLTLEMVFDPEESTLDSLVLYIGTSLEVDEGLDKMREFDLAWWFDATDAFPMLIHNDVEFIDNV